MLARYSHGHAEDAFSEVVRRYLDLVHSAALRQVRSPQLAEEVTQSTFLKLARHAPRLAPTTILPAWLYQVARRESIDVVRREARRQLREAVSMEINAMNATADDWPRIEPILDEAMDALNEDDRSAVLLRYFENKSLHEVGQTLGTTEDSARKRVNRAIEQLRNFFAKRGVAVGASGLVMVISAKAVQAAPIGMAVTISTAAALSGVTVATTATIAANIVTMTIAKKALLGAILFALLAIGTYEARRAFARKEVRPKGEIAATQQVPPITKVEAYDTNRIHPKLRELAMPYKSVSTYVGTDGGIGMTIVDRDGRKLDLGVPSSSDGASKYSEIAFGPKLEPLTEDTRRMLVTVLTDYRAPKTPDANDHALNLLRDSR